MAESTAPAASSSVLSGALRGLSTEATCIELDVTPILMNTMAVAFFMHFGYSVGASTHVGNLMGSNRPAAARVASVVTLALVVAISGGSGLALLAFGDRYARLFTDDPEVLDKLTAALPIMALYMPVDAIGIGCLNNLLRAINVVNIPAALIFGAICKCGAFFLLLT
jgi:MATE family multidrug resistance protein